jgi:hypothetical protein
MLRNRNIYILLLPYKATLIYAPSLIEGILRPPLRIYINNRKAIKYLLLLVHFNYTNFTYSPYNH